MKKNMAKLTLLAAVTALVLCCAGAAADVPETWCAKDWGGYKWKVEGNRIKDGETSGSWRTGIRARADGGPGDSISMSTSKTVSNTVSGSFGISRNVLNGTFKFDVSRSWSASATKAYGLTGKKKGSWWAIQYKPVYKKYKVKVRRYGFVDGTWKKTRKTGWIRAKRFDHFAYRLVKGKSPAK